MSPPSQTLRWGMCCASMIGYDFSAALRLLPTSEQDIVAVAARSIDKAKTFAEKLNIPKTYASYEELAQDPNVDIVYVGSIHPCHYEHVKLFLNAGKHVLVEKPIAMNSRQLDEMLSLARDKQLFLMEAFWSRFFPIYSRIRQALDNGDIGDVILMSAEFGNTCLGGNPRFGDRELGGGALMDQGCYTLMFAHFVFRGEVPEKITANARLRPEGCVDEMTNMTLEYRGGRVARLCTAIVANLEQKAIIHGTKGKIVVPNFWCPTEVSINGETFTEPLPKSELPLNYTNSEGLMYEAQHVRDCILKGEKESPIMSHRTSTDIMAMLDEIRKQCNISYPADQQ